MIDHLISIVTRGALVARLRPVVILTGNALLCGQSGYVCALPPFPLRGMPSLRSAGLCVTVCALPPFPLWGYPSSPPFPLWGCPSSPLNIPARQSHAHHHHGIHVLLHLLTTFEGRAVASSGRFPAALMYDLPRIHSVGLSELRNTKYIPRGSYSIMLSPFISDC
jgi:hypothetical protein